MDLLIRNIENHFSLTPEEIQLISTFWDIKSLKRNEYLLRNDQVCRYDAFVLSGALKLFFINQDTGKEEIVSFAIRDWWASDLKSFHEQTPSDMNIQAIKPTSVAVITKSGFEDLLKTIPKLERYFRMILQSNVAAWTYRTYLRNALDAEQRYIHFLKRYPQINREIPQYLIASYLGMSAEMLSKIRARFAR